MNLPSKFCLKTQSTQWKPELPHPVVLVQCYHVPNTAEHGTPWFTRCSIFGVRCAQIQILFLSFMSTEPGVKFISPNPDVI